MVRYIIGVLEQDGPCDEVQVISLVGPQVRKSHGYVYLFIFIYYPYIFYLLILIFIFRFIITTVPMSSLHLWFVSCRGWQTTTHAPNLTQGLFLCDPRAENGFYIFKCCRKKKKKEHATEILCAIQSLKCLLSLQKNLPTPGPKNLLASCA